MFALFCSINVHKGKQVKGQWFITNRVLRDCDNKVYNELQ